MIATQVKQAKLMTYMKQEAEQAAQLIREQLVRNQSVVESVASRLTTYAPHSVMFVGRGSSDHAGTFAKYLIEIEIGIPAFAAAPSIATVYNRTVDLSKTLVIIISQSGRSPDILEQAKQAKNSGALCLALVNDENSPLTEIVDFVIPLSAGEEKSVAATKSYLATLSAVLQLVAYWKNDSGLINALSQIPDALTVAVNAEQQLRFDDLEKVRNLVVLGRGLGFAVGKEIALKLKEVCAIHAECFSSAEFLHGPVTLVDDQFKILNVSVEDESVRVHQEQILEMKNRGALVVDLHQVIQELHPRIAPLAVLQRFYLDIESIAVERGLNPDLPRGLKKVTKTI
jgi:glucosamine--fructose-6-phosphate aminotransferase (isomerizing)